MSTFLCPTDGVCQLCSPPAASQPHPPPGLWNRCFPANVCFHQCGPQRRGESHTPVEARPQTHASTKLGCLWKTTWEIRSLSYNSNYYVRPMIPCLINQISMKCWMIGYINWFPPTLIDDAVGVLSRDPWGDLTRWYSPAAPPPWKDVLLYT